MDDHELEVMLSELETDRIERKATLSEKDVIRKNICAFANDISNHNQPGILFIGANDDGTPSDISVTDQMLLSLSDMRSDGNIIPFPSITVQKRLLKGAEMAVVTVQPADAPPVRYKGRTYVRVGPRMSIATPEEERRLAEKRRWKDLPFDIRPVLSASIDDLNLSLFRDTYLPAAVSAEILDANNRTLYDQLASLRMITPEQEPIPTTLGILTIGKSTQRFISGAYIQFVRFEGDDLSSQVLDEKVLAGPLPEMLPLLDDLLLINIATRLDFTGSPKEIRHPEYPIVALQQIIRNAILHRTYEGTNSPVRINWFKDRIEITSPGGPFGNVNIENFGHPGATDYRNQNLAAVMKDLGYVQKFGAGIELTRSHMQKNGNPSPVFDVSSSFVTVTLRRGEAI